MNQFLSMHYRLGFRQGWILPCMDQIGNIWCGSLEKITMVAVSSSWGAHPRCASVLPCVHAVSEQRGSLSACGERPCSPCGDRRRFASSTKGRALSACIGSPTSGSTCGRVFFSLCVEGRRSKPSAIALFSRAIAERLGKRLSRDLPHRPCCCVAVALSASPALSYG